MLSRSFAGASIDAFARAFMNELPYSGGFFPFGAHSFSLSHMDVRVSSLARCTARGRRCIAEIYFERRERVQIWSIVQNRHAESRNIRILSNCVKAALSLAQRERRYGAKSRDNLCAFRHSAEKIRED